MQDLLLLMAQLMPEEDLIEEIKSLSTEYTITKDEETKKKLQMYCTLLVTKEATQGKDIAKISKELEETKRIRERMNTNEG